jgi:hypothetical protein
MLGTPILGCNRHLGQELGVSPPFGCHLRSRCGTELDAESRSGHRTDVEPVRLIEWPNPIDPFLLDANQIGLIGHDFQDFKGKAAGAVPLPSALKVWL